MRGFAASLGGPRRSILLHCRIASRFPLARICGRKSRRSRRRRSRAPVGWAAGCKTGWLPLFLSGSSRGLCSLPGGTEGHRTRIALAPSPRSRRGCFCAVLSEHRRVNRVAKRRQIGQEGLIRGERGGQRQRGHHVKQTVEDVVGDVLGASL
jgi:hypothetical protein